MSLTQLQTELIKNTNPEDDYCLKARANTMQSLVDKGFAKFTEGFGFKYGGIVELTEKGKKMHVVLNAIQKHKAKKMHKELQDDVDQAYANMMLVKRTLSESPEKLSLDTINLLLLQSRATQNHLTQLQNKLRKAFP